MKELNRILLGLGSVSALAPAVSAAQEAPEKTRPNILFIAVDDLKTSVSPYGDTLARTPSLERIASEGVTFMNNYFTYSLSLTNFDQQIPGEKDNGEFYSPSSGITSMSAQ